MLCLSLSFLSVNRRAKLRQSDFMPGDYFHHKILSGTEAFGDINIAAIACIEFYFTLLCYAIFYYKHIFIFFY